MKFEKKFVVKATDLLTSLKEVNTNSDVCLMFISDVFFATDNYNVSNTKKAAIYDIDDYEIVLTPTKTKILIELAKILTENYNDALIVFRYDDTIRKIEIGFINASLDDEMKKVNELFRELAKTY